MADKSKIEWTDATWNPIRGCSLVSGDCTNCYAMRQAHRQSGPGAAYEGLTRMTEHGPIWIGDVRLVPELLDQPLCWKRPRRIFVNSMSDLFHEQVPDQFIDKVFAVMALAGQHNFQVLTKRPERMRDYLNSTSGGQISLTMDQPQWVRLPTRKAWPRFPEAWPLSNVWLGISCEDQKSADERIPMLLQIPAAVRWVSAEPLLGPMDLTGWFYSDEPGGLASNKPQWVVVGGESGPHARPMHPDWVRSIRDQCYAAGVPFFFKQWGRWGHGFTDDPDPKGRTWALWPDGQFTNQWRPGPEMNGSAIMYDVGKKRAGHLLDGQEWREYPRKANSE